MATDVPIIVTQGSGDAEKWRAKELSPVGAGNEATPADDDLQSSFRQYDQQITINNIQLGCLLGMLLMPAGVILDFFTYNEKPQVIWEFFELRLLCSALIGA